MRVLDETGRMAAAERELTARAVATGIAVGALLAIANLYMGLKTGWWDSGQVTASILSYALGSLLARRGRRPGPLETNAAQCAATAVGAAPAALGLLGAVPALAILGAPPRAWAVAALGVPVAVLGVLAALALRRRLFEEDRLPFPTGVATAEVIRTLHGDAAAPAARALGVAGALSAGATMLRELAGLPGAVPLPLQLAGFPAARYTLALGWNPMLLGAGLLAGPRNGLSVLLGALVAWGAISPRLVTAGVVAAPEYGALVGWLAWPGVALIVGAALASLATQWRAFAAGARDVLAVGHHRPGSRGAAALAAVAAVAACLAAWAGFGLSPLHAIAGLALAAALTAACARAVGQTDILPAGEMAQVSQLALARAGDAVANVGGGALAAGMSAQAGVALWSLRAGHGLGASPRAQARAMLAGLAVGSLICLPAYAVLVSAWGIGTEALPAPAAAPWRAIAEVVTKGGAALPPGAAASMAVALVLGAALELAGRRVTWLPSPAALGMGFLAPAQYAVAICAGSLAGVAWRRLAPALAAARLAPVAAGAIAGEAVTGAIAAAIAAARGSVGG
jgi:uncharacterized oligopeptide transporter (OPT) family protein